MLFQDCLFSTKWPKQLVNLDLVHLSDFLGFSGCCPSAAAYLLVVPSSGCDMAAVEHLSYCMEEKGTLSQVWSETWTSTIACK